MYTENTKSVHSVHGVHYGDLFFDIISVGAHLVHSRSKCAQNGAHYEHTFDEHTFGHEIQLKCNKCTELITILK